MADAPLTLADQAVINLAAALLIPALELDAPGTREELDRLLGRVSRGHSRMRPLAEALERMRDAERNPIPARDKTGWNEVASARWAARDALAELFRWRAGLALAQMQREPA